MKSELELSLNKLAQQAFESHNWNFQPLFPNVLIRVFDFEDSQATSLIIKPQTAQAPNHRAIVVRTWQPKQVEYKGNKFTVASELQPGDLITVPYYAGVPTGVESIDDAGYRIVPENKYRNYNTGAVETLGATQETPHIFFKQGMFDKQTAVLDLLHSIATYVGIKSELVDSILVDYDIVPKRLSLAQN